jgi:hypothetical protein
MLSSGPGNQLWDPLLALLWKEACCLSCVCSLRVHWWEFNSLPCPLSLGQVQYSIPSLLPVLDYSSLFMCFSFVGGWGGFSLSGSRTCLCSQGVVRGVTRGAWCSPVCLPIHMQAGLVPVVAGRNVTNFSQCSMVWRGFPQARGSGCHRVWFWLMLCLWLDGRRRREGKKKIKEKCPGVGVSWGQTCLAGCAAGWNC